MALLTPPQTPASSTKTRRSGGRKVQAKEVERKSKGPFTFPATSLCLNDDKGDVIVRSLDEYEWKLRSVDLRSSSDLFDDLLTSRDLTFPVNAAPIVITLPFSASDIHHFLHFILHHYIEPQPVPPASLPLSPDLTDALASTIAVLDYCACEKHLVLARREAMSLWYRRNESRVSIIHLFQLANENRWLDLAKKCLSVFDGYTWWRFTGSTGKGLEPEHWPLCHVDKLGARGFRSLVVCCRRCEVDPKTKKNTADEGTEDGEGAGRGSKGKPKVDWKKVAEMWQFEMPEDPDEDLGGLLMINLTDDEDNGGQEDDDEDD